MNKKGLIGNLIGGFVAILIGIALIPTIMEQVKIAQNSSMIINDSSNPLAAGSGAMATMIDLLPLIFGGLIIFAGLVMAYSALRDAGLWGGDDEDIFKDTRTDEEKMIDKLRDGEDYEDDDEEEDEEEEEEIEPVKKKEKYIKIDKIIDKMPERPSGNNITKEMEKQIEDTKINTNEKDLKKASDKFVKTKYE